jgi:hypothetical protein
LLALYTCRTQNSNQLPIEEEEEEKNESVNSPSLKEKPKNKTRDRLLYYYPTALQAFQNKQKTTSIKQQVPTDSERPLNSLAQKKPISASERAMEKAQIPNTRSEHEISGRYYCH